MATHQSHAGTERSMRLCAHGSLDDLWLSRLSWITVTIEQDAHGEPLTVLSGNAPDQCSIVGAINLLHDLGIELVAFEIRDTTNP
jgi:hypothetical protein